MSVTDISVDTLAYADLVKIGLEDIPGASQREWTLHGAVDPGITILELLAYQLEQRLFMADQLTEPMVRASLRLLELDEPQAAQSAVTVLSLTAEGAVNPLPAGTVFALERDAGARAFATDADVWVQPVAAADVTAPLELTLRTTTGAPSTGGELSLLVEVASAPGVAPAWSPDAVDVEPPAELRWEAIGPAGTVAAVDVQDGTGALRRSGLLTLAWPAVWGEAGGDAPRLRAVATRSSYTEAVRIVAVAPNAVVARHRAPRSADVSDQVAAFLALPGQKIDLPDAAGRLLTDVVLTVSERDGQRHDWTSARSWVAIGPEDRVFLLDRDRGTLRFGDGRAGRILRPAQAPDAQVRFALGGGREGNLGASGAWAQDGGAATAINPVAAAGGAEAESLELARQRAADALTTRDRTVTKADASALAETTPGLGLARAHTTPGFHPRFPCGLVPGALSVTIVPYADRDREPGAWTAAPQPDAGAIETVRRRLERARLLGQEIFVLAPEYRAVSVDLSVSATTRAGDVRGRIVDELRRFLDPLVGGSEKRGWPFGGAVRPSALAGVVQRLLGSEATVTRVALALDDGPWTDCADAEIGERELVYLASANVRWVAALPAGGGLR
jgi:predicted phage baseplate assembly protein